MNPVALAGPRLMVAAGVVPANTVAPVVSGTTTVGQTLSCTTGTWTNTPTSYAYQWLNEGASISGATSSTYLLQASDALFDISCRVTASNTSGAGTPAVSNEIGPVGGLGFDYYIGPSGSNSNSGLTVGAPWALSAINDSGKQALYAGKTVGLLDGTYDIPTLIGPPGSNNDPTSNLLRPAAGTVSAWTVIKSVNPRGAILDYNRAGMTRNQHGLIGSSGPEYIEIDGFEMKRTHYTACALYYTANITIKNCHIHDHNYDVLIGGAMQNSACIRTNDVDHVTISNCRMEDFAADGDADRCAGIIMFGPGSGSDDCIVEYCTIKSSATAGGSTDAMHIKNTVNGRNTVRYNYLDMTAGGGSALKWSTSSSGSDTELMHNNILISNDPMQSESSGAALRRIFNNNFIAISNFTTGGPRWQSDSGDVEFFNNIVTRNTTGYRGDVNLVDISPSIMDYNFYGDGSPSVVIGVGSSPTTYSGLAAWQAASSRDGNSINDASAGFVASGSEAAYYALAGGSACLSAGKSDGTGGGSTVDIGAWGNGATRIGSDF